MPSQESRRSLAGDDAARPAPSLVVEHQRGVAEAQEQQRLAGVAGAGDGLGLQGDTGDGRALEEAPCAVIRASIQGPGRLPLGRGSQLRRQQLVGPEPAEVAVQRPALSPYGAQHLSESDKNETGT